MKNKRFIAGAVCPSCSEMDKIFTYSDDAQKWRACAACDFLESFNEQTPSTQELATRVNQNRLGEQALAHETPVERVTFIGQNQQSKDIDGN